MLVISLDIFGNHCHIFMTKFMEQMTSNKGMFSICLAITCYIILMLETFHFDLIIDLVFNINFVRNKCIKYTDVIFVYLHATQPSDFYVCVGKESPLVISECQVNKSYPINYFLQCGLYSHSSLLVGQKIAVFIEVCLLEDYHFCQKYVKMIQRTSPSPGNCIE